MPRPPRTPRTARPIRAALGLAACGLALAACARRPRPFDPESVVTVSGGTIEVRTSSPFLRHLEVAPLAPTQGPSRPLRLVGQIIALANPSDELVGPATVWSQLDPGLSRSLGLNLGAARGFPAGSALGLVAIPEAYRGRVARGDAVVVSPYALEKLRWTAHLDRVEGPTAPGGDLRAVFRLDRGGTWAPGDTCIVRLKGLRGRPRLLPSTSLLHEGLQEYVLTAPEPGRFRPVPVQVMDTLGDQVQVLGDLHAGEEVVDRGAILLKPFLHQVLRAAAAAEARP